MFALLFFPEAPFEAYAQKDKDVGKSGSLSFIFYLQGNTSGDLSHLGIYPSLKVSFESRLGYILHKGILISLTISHNLPTNYKGILNVQVWLPKIIIF